jgi:hypothetical protein
VQVLIASAFWTSGSVVPWQLLLRFSLVMAPLERRLGTRRTISIFAAGHVLATVLVVAGIDYGVRNGMLDLQLAHVSDVGVSYGLFAVAGALTWLLVPAWWRAIWVLALTAAIAVGSIGGLTFTDVGHVLSLLIGLSSYPFITRWQRNPAPRALLAGQPVVIPRELIRRVVRLRHERTRGTEPGSTPAASSTASVDSGH